ncbi:MAG TPA: hypothetical protein VND45_11280 [Thermoanaerobaculia bacterium]|jgi:hypothetical protein|nr:hypothetical protein [Thermoanaerobaculia bacterium]
MRALPLIATLLLTLIVHAAAPIPPEKEQWHALTAGEFRIYGNASEREMRNIAGDLLRMREALGKVTRLNVRDARPTYVFLFRNERSFAPIRDALFRQKDAAVSGAFLSGQLANFIVLDASTRGGGERVVYHELTHYFVRNTTPGLPLWFDEGLAEYYSTFGVSGEEVSIGRPIVAHVQWLREHPLMPMSRQFAIDMESPEYSGDSRHDSGGAFYAQSWGLVHYFLAGGDARRQQLARFFAALRGGKSSDEAFRSSFGSDYAALEHELRSYMKRPTMNYLKYRLDELVVPELPAMRPVPRDELLYVLGTMFARNRGTDADAETLLSEALRLNPANAEAQAGLGYVKGMRGDRAGANVHFEKAVSLGSRDAAVYLLYGSSLVEGDPSDADNLRARQLFERAVQLDANDARAWAGVGMTYVGAKGDVAPGIAALEKSLSSPPRRTTSR